MKKWLIVAVTILALASFFIFNRSYSNEKNYNLLKYVRDASLLGKDLNDCESNEVFSISPINLSDLSQITPLGNLNPTGHVFPTDHMYFNVRRTQDGSMAMLTTFYSPGDIYVDQISSSEYLGENRIDYSIDFRACKQIWGKFGHISSISEKLQSQIKDASDCQTYSTGGTTVKMCRKNVGIKISAGEKIGTVGGLKGGSAGLDFWLSDYRTSELKFANPSRWSENDLHNVCATDYFMSDVRDGIKEKIGGWNGLKRVIEPICGTIAQDIIGTAQGDWYAVGKTDHEDPHLALVHDNINPTVPAFSIGTSTNMHSGVYTFAPASSGFVNIDFNNVKSDGNIYCYNAQGKYLNPSKTIIVILVQLTSSKTLKIEKANLNDCGTGPWSFENPAEFER